MQASTPTQRPQSAHLLARAERTIPGGVNSPVRAFHAVGGKPLFIQRANGAHLWDADGQQFIDYVGSWGPMIAGHAHPAVIQAVHSVAQNSLSFGAPCELEIRLAETLCERLPAMEQVRFVNSGTEATLSALRLARAATGRNKVIKFAGCYHGHADSYLVNAGSGALTLGTPSSPGVPTGVTQDTLTADFNDLDSVDRLFAEYSNSIAAIIVEPIAGNMNLIKPLPGFLEGLRQRCDQYGVILIFDEVMTGFRVDSGGCQTLYNIEPDLTTLGKVIGGGMPVGAFGGKRDLMQQLAPVGPVYQAGTLSGNPVAMAAGLTTLNLLTPDSYVQLNTRAKQLITGLQAAANQHRIPFHGCYEGGMLGMFFTSSERVDHFSAATAANEKHFITFFQHMLNHGVYLAPSRFEAGFLSLAHTEADIQDTISAAERSFAALASLPLETERE